MCMAVTATDAPVGRVTLRIAFLLICPPSFPLGACEPMLVFQEHLLAMFPAGFVQHFTQSPALSPPKPVPALLHPPQDGLVHLCECWTHPACLLYDSPHLYSAGGCLQHCCVCFVARVRTCPLLSHVAQNEDVAALFFPLLSWEMAACRCFTGTVQVVCSRWSRTDSLFWLVP